MRSSSKVFICFRLYCSRFPGMSSRFAAAVIQRAPVVFEPNATLVKVRDLTADASKQGAKLVVFPEAFVSAYPKVLDFGARVGSRTSKGRDEFRKHFDSAIDVPGRATEELSYAPTTATRGRRRAPCGARRTLLRPDRLSASATR